MRERAGDAARVFAPPQGVVMVIGQGNVNHARIFKLNLQIALKQAQMAEPFADISTKAGRRKAWNDMLWRDHGFLRAGFRNLHALSPKMWRANQPLPHQVRADAERGIKTIINLRGENYASYYLLEAEACAKYGVTLETLRIKSRDTPSREVIAEAKALFARIQYPALLHCKSGSDRAGLMSVLYLILHENAPFEEARKHLSCRYGHVKEGKTGLLDAFLDSYAAYNAHTPIDFFDWSQTVYDPVAVKAAFMDSWWANVLVDKILRRE
jgi:protein tyrosine phosphatase (PTP) superfamily phosphohydrolase (DUF442 family)